MNREKGFNVELQNYANNNSLRFSPYQRELIDYTMKYDNNLMMGAFECVQHFQLLVKAIQAKKCLEVGCYTGYTTLSLAQALDEQSQVYTLDVTSKYVAFDIWKKAGVDHKIKFIEGAASESMTKLLNEGHEGTFDFVFIDADKTGYRNYYELAIKLVRKGGIIAIDNVLFFGRVIDPNTDRKEETQHLRELNEFIHKDERVDVSMLVIGDGVTFCLKR